MENYALDYDHEHEQDVSDSESCISEDSNKSINCEGLFDDDLTRISEDEPVFGMIGQNYFLKNLRGVRKDVSIEAIHKINWSKSVIMQARLKCFNIFRLALLQFDYNCDGGGCGNGVTYSAEYAWYCDSKQGIQSIASNGFGYQELDPNYHGIHLFPYNSIAKGVQKCVEDDDGLKHVLLCRVLMKRSKENVDDAITPSQYVVCSTKMNTHILPEYVVSFRTIPCLEGSPKARLNWKKPASTPWLPFTTLISIINKSLPSNTMNLIYENYKDFKKGKISRQDWIQKLRRFAGNDLLINTIKNRGANNY